MLVDFDILGGKRAGRKTRERKPRAKNSGRVRPANQIELIGGLTSGAAADPATGPDTRQSAAQRDAILAGIVNVAGATKFAEAQAKPSAHDVVIPLPRVSSFDPTSLLSWSHGARSIAAEACPTPIPDGNVLAADSPTKAITSSATNPCRQSQEIIVTIVI